ncbi:hypothetical protein BGZ99_005891 [Dissophora globulifera]|uniref:Uncharacterized protein n=1 Tax=Dissophora globulifera TaxID=979702 RepID=A0A9P6RHU0_9FUNG|nr:hypothetical protein BGZ99_005891 [Dissophora globulifera]
MAREFSTITAGVEETVDTELWQALLAHGHGGIVSDELARYKELDEDTCQQRFADTAQTVAKRLAGSLVQSKTSVLLVLKVEIYGRTRSEDPHEQPLAFPLLRSYHVESVAHGGAKKLLIGTDSWLALVTSCIVLTSGEVIVGPHNTHCVPHRHSKVWTRDDFVKNGLVERQLRSKFHEQTTFVECSGVFHLFQRPSCLPVTLRTLYEHFIAKSASGIKVLAATFMQLHKDKALSRSSLEKQVGSIATETTVIVQELRFSQLKSMAVVEAKEFTAITAGVEETVDTDLSQALLASRYGGIVHDELARYKELDHGTCQQCFAAAAQTIAKKLAGSLVQSKTCVLLVLKVEIYGRTRCEDPHEQPLALPLLRPYVVESVTHGGAKKLLIGTDLWLALVTSCVVLTSGEIIVGPHNTHFTPHKLFKVWTRDDFVKNGLVERQLRSKFHEPTTFMECGGVFNMFRRHTCLPVTLRTLKEHFAKSASGIKALAATFYKLHKDKDLSRSALAKQVGSIATETTVIAQELRLSQLKSMAVCS